jgi:hypothetical protein
MNPTRLQKVLLPDWARGDIQGTKGDRVYDWPHILQGKAGLMEKQCFHKNNTSHTYRLHEMHGWRRETDGVFSYLSEWRQTVFKIGPIVKTGLRKSGRK